MVQELMILVGSCKNLSIVRVKSFMRNSRMAGLCKEDRESGRFPTREDP
jgi:hypothetical protein